MHLALDAPQPVPLLRRKSCQQERQNFLVDAPVADSRAGADHREQVSRENDRMGLKPHLV